MGSSKPISYLSAAFLRFKGVILKVGFETVIWAVSPTGI
jgi:hypothetical protein